MASFFQKRQPQFRLSEETFAKSNVIYYQC